MWLVFATWQYVRTCSRTRLCNPALSDCTSNFSILNACIDDVLSFISTTMVFGTPVDITLSELALEAFYPADEATAAKLRELARSV